MNRHQKLRAAENPNTPQETLELLATDEYYYIRHLITQNPNTPIKTLELLAIDELPYVRRSVLLNPNKTQIIERLVFMTNYNQFSS
jgi:hypothetical protein